MDAYRDQYAQLFGDTAKVKLLAISVDPDTMLAAWAKEKGYQPWTFLSDSGAVVGTKYVSTRTIPNNVLLDNRNLYIVGPDGRITYATAFKEVDPTSYTDLGAAVKKAAGGS